MTMQEWIDRYEAKAEKFSIDDDTHVFFSPEDGFICWQKIGESLYLNHTCVKDVEWARARAYELAKENGCRYLITLVKRNPVAYQRLTRAHFVPGESRRLANGEFYWAFEEKVV